MPSRAERDEAEVKRVDLSETLLLLAAAGISKPEHSHGLKRRSRRHSQGHMICCWIWGP